LQWGQGRPDKPLKLALMPIAVGRRRRPKGINGDIRQCKKNKKTRGEGVSLVSKRRLQEAAKRKAI